MSPHVPLQTPEHSGPDAQLMLRRDPSRVAPLQRATPTTIGRAEGNRLRLASLGGVADHHAVVRFSRSQGWLVCDWQSGGDGTYLEGERVHRCRRLSDGDEIRLGVEGPVLVFRLAAGAGAEKPVAAAGAAVASGSASASPRQRQPAAAAAPLPASPVPPAASPAPPPASPVPAAGAPLVLGGRTIALPSIRSVHLRSRRRHPHSFSWWVLICLGGMVLLPWPWLFWGVEIAALAAWIVLGSRKEHELLLTLHDGMAHRHRFANRITALSHRNGIRRAIGQELEGG